MVKQHGEPAWSPAASVREATGSEAETSSIRIAWAVRANSGDLLRAAALGGAGIVLLPT